MSRGEWTSAYQGQRVLITGGLGFIGSNLAFRLAELGASVDILDSLHPEFGGNRFNIHGLGGDVRVHIGDLSDKPLLARLLPEIGTIFNLAAQVSHVQSMRDPIADLESNLRSQLCFLEACRRHNPGARILFTSTRQVYGKPRALPVDETHPVDPVDINAIHKLAAERYHLLYHRVYGLRPVLLRLTNVYGPRMRAKDRLKNFFGWWIRQVLEDREILVYGDGRQVRDLLFVEDAVEAVLRAAADPETTGQVYNVGGSEPVRLIDLARLLIDAHGGGHFRLTAFPAERKRIDIGDYVADSGKVTRATGWMPAVPLRDGILRTLDYYRRYKEHYWSA